MPALKANFPTLEDYNERELLQTKNLVCDLLDTHWNGIEQAIIKGGDGIGSVSIAIKLDHQGPARDVKVKIGYAVKTTDEAEVVVSDPRQEEFKL